MSRRLHTDGSPPLRGSSGVQQPFTPDPASDEDSAERTKRAVDAVFGHETPPTDPDDDVQLDDEESTDAVDDDEEDEAGDDNPSA